LKAIHQLLNQPELGKELEDEPLAGLLIAGDYIVRYAIKGEVIYVLKIWHGKNIGGRQPKHATGENMPVTRCN
jgi:hypothetical protein